MPDMKTVTKSLVAFEIKDGDKGEVEAVVATLGVVDKDGDIVHRGAIPNGSKVVMSAYGHDAVYGQRPVGKGVISIKGDKALFKGRVFLSTQGGRETFDTLKEMGSDQQWSFGFRVLGDQVPDEAQQKAGCQRVLMKLDAFEVSPVLIGAGVDTMTVATKQADGDPGTEPADASTVDDKVIVAGTVADPPPSADAGKAAAVEMETKAREAAGDTFKQFQRTLRRHGVA